MRRTKIVCTIGPSSNTEERISQLIEAGMNVARLNLSHGTREEHLRRASTIRDVSRRLKTIVGLLIDTRGPEVRIGKLAAEPVFLEEGQELILTAEQIVGNRHKIAISYPGLIREIEPGHLILLDDGLITLKVIAISDEEILCHVVYGGELFSNKGINLPGTSINLPALQEKDRDDIKALMEHNIDFVAASFTRRWEDIVEVRRLVEECRGEAKIIAKIENREGLANFESILDISDGMMVARGDLGVEVPTEEVPLLQKKIVESCNRAGKPVITATQMLESMIRSSRPTRAEASDVANAIFDGTDAVMLSGETAIGRFPVEAVNTMRRIAERTEEALQYKKNLERFEPLMKKTITDAIGYATCHIAQVLSASAVITPTQSGHTARMVSKYRPKARIVAVTPSYNVAAALQLTWGVYPVLCPPSETTDEMFSAAIQSALKEGLIKDGELVVITAGVPVGVSGTTNLLRVETVGEVIIAGKGIGKISISGAAFVAGNKVATEQIQEGQVLVIRSTEPHHLEAIEKAAALVIEEGGLTSHGAIIALNLGKPAVVGADGATRLIRQGELITVDTIRGLIYRGKATVL